MARKTTKKETPKRRLNPQDRGRIVLEIPGIEIDEDGEIVGDTLELHLEDWDFEPGTPHTYHHPGDPAEVTVTVAWVSGDKFTRTGAELDELCETHFDEIYQAIEDYEADRQDFGPDNDDEDMGW